LKENRISQTGMLFLENSLEFPMKNISKHPNNVENIGTII
jgi:hypothetical protein